MKQDRVSVSTLLIAVILAILVSYSCVMCLQDAFSLGCAPLKLLSVCAAASVLSGAAMWPKRSWPFFMTGLIVYLAVLLWQREALLQSVGHFLYRVTSEYAYCFPQMPVIGREATDAAWVLSVLGVPLAWLTAWVVSREGSVALVILACLPVLVVCLVIVDLSPVLWLVLLVGALMILVISQNVRDRNHNEGGHLAWWLILPTVILISAITVLWPPADYVRADWSDALQTLAETKVDLEAWQEEVSQPVPQWNRELKTVDLSRVGPKTMTGTPVLDYRTGSPIAYLRGVSLGVYKDNTWTALDSAEYQSYGIAQTPLVCAVRTSGTLEVQTRGWQPLLYTAYDLAALPESAAAVDDAYVKNTGLVSGYSVYFGSETGAVPAGYDSLAVEQYLQIPEELREPLAAIVSEAGLQGASAEAAAAYVRNNGVYDLNTAQVPEGKDFVLYFLQESHRGYCIHFASATVMLLRSMGIPARYVTGYSVSGAVAQWNEVTEDDAHAWVEYYGFGAGWTALDPTPAGAGQEEPPAQTDVPEPEPETSGMEPEPEVHEQETMQPAVTAPGADAESGTQIRLPKELLWLLALLGLGLLVWLRWWCGLRYRRKRCSQGHPNRRTMTWWRWLVQLSKAQSRQISEELLCLAEKARFSQHTMTEEEITQLQTAVEMQIEQLKTASVGKRLWCRFGLVLY